MSSELFHGLAVLSFVILLLIMLLRKIRQPYFIAYILSGVLLGPQVCNIVNEAEVISQLGEMGIVLLMFFIGSEIRLPDLTRAFARPLFIASVQVAVSLACMWGIGTYLEWSTTMTVLMGFIISLSSSAIVFQYLSRTGEMNSQLGLITSGVLLIQDILVVPMVVCLNFMAAGNVSAVDLAKVCAGGMLILLLLRAVSVRRPSLPFKRDIIADHDLQVFLGFAICFGMAWVTAWLGLSAALGAFVAGIVIGKDKATRWLGKALIPFRVFFLAFFFIAVGLQLDLPFFRDNVGTIVFVALSVLLINSLLNAMLFRLAGNSWRDSLYGGALLSQIGEFSFVLMTLAVSLGLVGNYLYQVTLAVITLTMLLSSFWITVMQRLIYRLPLPEKTTFS
ncbi:cation:proton antiporter [Flavobacterium sp. MAH-1]|uniref:Cation:proton antiporter n=1 Tax=Flavobacterium agri TaxID=2743471 RepID=A0A7Y8Y3Q5_9FLAO|nr:cation:proton antiporter [Flavobacterium agri]NUY81942.1 cation:proton antiporter [Flavobacterium agri]NYA71966.1 cation:proton antiporter [Flavobacterium agri]